MCLAVPVQVINIKAKMAMVELSGVRRQISVAFVPEAQVGDYVLVHAGYAIQVVDEQEAEATLALLRELSQQGCGCNIDEVPS